MPGAGNPLAWDRYAYTLDNPVRYVDPTGNASEHPPICSNGCPIWDYSDVGGPGFGGRLLRAIISTGTEIIDFFITNGTTFTNPKEGTWNLSGTEDRLIAGFVPPILLGVNYGRQLPLRKALGITDQNIVAHHLIPQSMADHPAVRMAMDAGWNIDHAYNGIGLPVELHTEVPGHPGYNENLLNRLDDLYDRAVKNSWSGEDMYDELINLADEMRARLGGGQ